MNYSDKELQQIEKFASIYLTISDMAVLLNMHAEVLRDEAPAEQQTHARGERGTPLQRDIFHVRQLAATVRFRDIFFLYTAEGLE